MPAVVSVNITMPAQVSYNGKDKIFSGILKKPVMESVFLDSLGFQGDGVADKRHHGGGDKAVCVYSLDHYPHWEKVLSKKITPGAFGENLTVSDLDENLVHIGDVFRVGETQIQVTQPRQPCHKVSKIFGLNNMSCQIQKTGFTGFYCRVIQPGWMKPGDKMVLVQKGTNQIAVGRANYLMYKDKKNLKGINELLSLDALSAEWKQFFATRLQKLEVLE